jgi:hypothetical protein
VYRSEVTISGSEGDSRARFSVARFIAIGVYTKYLLRNLRDESKRSCAKKGKEDGTDNHR